MKKISLFTVLTVILLSFTIAGCGKKDAVEETVEEQVLDEVTEEPKEEVKEAEKPEAVEEAAPTEAVEEKAEVETDKSANIIYNNGGHFLGYGDWIYYLEPSDKAMQSAQLFGNFIDYACGETTLQAYNLKTGNFNPLFTDYGYGRLWVSGDYLFVDVFNPDVEGTDKVVMYNLKTGERDYASGEKLIMGDPKCEYVVTRENYDGAYIYFVYKDGEEIGSYTENTFGECIAIQDGYLVLEYSIDDDHSKAGFKCIDWNNDSEVLLGKLPYSFAQDEMGWPEYGQWKIEDKKLYLTYGWYEGTGHFLADQCWITAELDKENSIVEIEELHSTSGADGEEVMVPFIVENGTMVLADGIPGKGFCSYNSGEYGYYDENGKKVVNGKGFETKLVEEGLSFSCECAELVGDRIFMYNNNFARDPENDIGWRYAYIRAYTSIFIETVGSNDGFNIISYTNPDYVDGD